MITYLSKCNISQQIIHLYELKPIIKYTQQKQKQYKYIYLIQLDLLLVKTLKKYI